MRTTENGHSRSAKIGITDFISTLYPLNQSLMCWNVVLDFTCYCM